MKLFFEKWTTETVWTGNLCGIDTDLLRERFENLKDLSDEEIINELKENDYMYDLYDLLEEVDTLQARNSSEDKSIDYQIDIHTEESIMDQLGWDGWNRGCSGFPRGKDFEECKSKFIKMIPEVKSFDMI
jgi:hypothetical protein